MCQNNCSDLKTNSKEVCNAVYCRLCIELMHKTLPVPAEGYDGSHHLKYAQCWRACLNGIWNSESGFPLYTGNIRDDTIKSPTFRVRIPQVKLLAITWADLNWFSPIGCGFFDRNNWCSKGECRARWGCTKVHAGLVLQSIQMNQWPWTKR